MTNKLSSRQIKKIFFSNFKIDPITINNINKLNLRYKNQNFEKLKLIRSLKIKLNNNFFWKSGDKNIQKWNDGWSYNLDQLKNNKKIFPSIIPYYYSKDIKLVLGGKIIQPISKFFEFKLFGVYRDFIFKKYLSDKTNIYEFGCGPLHNLVILKKLFKNKNIYGFDWSDTSLQISKYLKKYFGLNVIVKKMNFFKVKSLKQIKSDSAIFTLGGFEQLGNNFKPVVDKIISSKVDIVINIESFVEFYRKNDLLEKTFLEYDKKRNYLNGYYDYLKKLENKNKIKILKINRIKFGILGHYSYSTVIWKPLNHKK